MNKVAQNIWIQRDFGKRLTKITCTNLLELNYDCLREILQHLDLAAQFSVLKTSKYFSNIILYDIWHLYHDATFDIIRDQSMAMQTKDFQSDFLALILENFIRIKGIQLEIFRGCMRRSSVKEFSKIVALHIRGRSGSNKSDSNNLDMAEFLKFPVLQELKLEGLVIEFTNQKYICLPLRSLQLDNVKILNDLEGEFWKTTLSSNLEKFILKFTPGIRLDFNCFTEIYKCVQLKELNLSCHHLCDKRILECILQLPSLQILTAESKGSLNFLPTDSFIFYSILKMFSKNPLKAVRGLHISGVPDKTFYLHSHLQDVTSLSWTITKIFQRQLDGSIVWKSDVTQVVNSFYDLARDSKNLEELIVRDNLFHTKRLAEDSDFEEKLQQCRILKGFKRLTIGNNSNKFNVISNNSQLPEGSVRFLIQKRHSV